MTKKEKNIQGKAFDFQIAKRILTYSKPYRTAFIACIVIVLILSALNISRPVLIQYTINNYILKNNLNMLQIMTFSLIGIVLTEALLQLLNMYLAAYIGSNIVKDMRNQVFSHLLKMRNKYFDVSPVGTLVTRSVSDIESLGEVFSQGFIVIFGDIFTLVVFTVAMFVVDWKLTLIAITTVPILIVATRIFKNGVKTTFQAVRNAVSALNTFVQEHISGMKVVQIFNRENEEYEKFKAINETHKEANIKSIWYYSVFFPVVEILSSISIGLIIWSGAFGGRAEAGTIVFFIMLINMFFRPIRMLADRINTLQMGMVACERVFKVMDTDEKIEEKGSKTMENVSGRIEFKNVWFAYNEEDWILKDVSFAVNSGETLAIVGSTGSGKSTIINLLGRFYEYNKGEILLDGVNIREYDLNELRRNIGIVLQDVFLFSETLEKNISMFNDKINADMIFSGAEKIGAKTFLENLPGGLNYNPGERGVTLSAGQRQIISFLRVYMQSPAILILDEATSNIDTETEILIQTATEILTQNRTSIIIAHRLSTIQKADRILVIESGQVIESGKLNELIEKDGNFKRLYDLQFK
ncbi:MAG: ABC transporter ATP-binding protein [Bacteroidota bacterium]